MGGGVGRRSKARRDRLTGREKEGRDGRRAGDVSVSGCGVGGFGQRERPPPPAAVC